MQRGAHLMVNYDLPLDFLAGEGVLGEAANIVAFNEDPEVRVLVGIVPPTRIAASALRLPGVPR